MLPIVAGPNDAAAGAIDSGWIMFEAVGLTKWTFALEANTADALAGWSVTIYGSNNQQLRQKYLQTLGSPTQPTDVAAAFPYTGAPLPGPAEQGGTGGIANPLTPLVPFFQYSGDLVAVRAIATGGTSGYINVTAEAVP